MIQVPAPPPPLPTSFDGLWARYRSATQAGDAERAAGLFQEIQRLRVERNIPSLDDLALAFVGTGLEGVRGGNAAAARADFRKAIRLDPNLPDPRLALARLEGPVAGLRAAVAGLTARLSTARGHQDFLYLMLAVGLLTALATGTVVALVLALGSGPLLRHDLEEAVGSHRRSLALGLYVFALLLPLITFQGYAWLPLWWMALLFVYLGRSERILVGILLTAAVLVGGVVAAVQPVLLAEQNPLLRASFGALERGPDARATALLESAAAAHPDDHDLVYLLGLEYRKAGRYAEAEALYRRRIGANPKDAVALNNLGNLQFSKGDYAAAAARYTQAAEAGTNPRYRGIAYYNLSIAQLQRFEFEPAKDTRSKADALAGRLTSEYERTWKFEKEGSVVPTVVDLGLTADEIWAKYDGAPQGVARENLAGTEPASLPVATFARGLVSRFAGFLVVFALALVALSRWRGARMFTVRCLKCGTPFCKLCHLGTLSAGLCTQCHHLYVVRDGVSGPARQRKLIEVHAEEARRKRMFHILSLLSPGAGHVYARKTIAGLILVVVWYGLLSALLLADRLLPLTQASGAVASRWPLALAALLLAAVYLAANLLTPSFEVIVTLPRRGAARPRVA